MRRRDLWAQRLEGARNSLPERGAAMASRPHITANVFLPATFGSGSLPESRIYPGSEWSAGASWRFPPLGHECRKANRIDGFTRSCCTGTSTGFGRPRQPSSSTRRCGFARNRPGFKESVCLGRRRLYALCRSFAEPQAGHNFVEWGLRLPPGQATPRIRPVGLSRLRRADRRTHRAMCERQERFCPTAVQRPSGLDLLFWPSSRRFPSLQACRHLSTEMPQTAFTVESTSASRSTSATSNSLHTTAPIERTDHEKLSYRRCSPRYFVSPLPRKRSTSRST